MAGIFQPTLQTQVQPERAVVDSSAATAINALTDVASGFFRSQQASKPSGPTYKQAKLEQFSNDLNRLQQLSETDGISRNRLQADLSLAARQVASLEVPEALRVQYENLSGSPFEAFSYDDPEEFQKNQLLKSDFAQGIRPSVITQIEAEGGAVTPEAVDAAVLAKVEEKNLLDNQVEIQRQNRALGRPVQTTPILESIQSDYQVLLDAVKGAQADSIVEQAEYRSLQTSVNNLIATKYTGFETNPEINGVIQQMNGLLNDIGKGVSSTPSAVLADTIQVALQSKGFSTSTIAIARAQLEQNPELFESNFGTNEKGETVADALVTILEGAGTSKPLVDIFNTSTAPERPVVAGEKPAAMDIPSVSENPEAYQQVVDKLSQSAATTDPNTLLGKTEARNSWLTTMNIVGSAVKSQSDEFILGEKLLSMFASNGVVKNLDAVYRTDPANAVQTNGILQEGLAAERIRQLNELNNRLNVGVGEGQLILADEKGSLQLNSDLIAANAASLIGGEVGWSEMRSKIAAAGGLENFLKLPKVTVRGANPDVSINVKGTTYFLKDMFRVDFDKVAKLSNNLRMIDTKLGNLQDLATKYQDDTNLFAGKSEGTTEGAQTFESITGFNVIADDGAFLGAVENVSQDLGINSADLLTAISFETVGTFNPAIKNPNSTATGLIQFLESTAKGLGTSTAELAQMSNVEQMAYVKKYLEPYKGRMKNLGDVYMAIHWPAGVGKDDSYVMYREGSENYSANKGLDVSGDGTVTRGEALQRVRQSAGSGGQGSIPQDQRITTTELPPREAEAQTTAPAQGMSAPAQTATDSTTIQAEAALDTEVGQEERTRTPSTPVATTAQPVVSQDVQNFLDSLSEEEKQSLLQILGGQ